MSRTAKIPQEIKKLLEQNHLISVSQMLTLFEKRGTQYNKTSIYRALDKLQADGEVCKQTFGDSEARYELRSEHHDHAVCTECDTIIPIACTHPSNKKIPGFIVDHHHTTIYGRCTNCS